MQRNKMSGRITKSILAGTSALAAGLTVMSAAGAVYAADSSTVSEVVVTGSRIARRDNVANSPIVTVTDDTFKSQSTIAVESSLNQLPQFLPGGTAFGLSAGDVQPSATNSPGAATLNLRGLGTNRNLVLVDGRRAQPANASLVVDVNTIPSALIDSVEVITGGASAVYGADAISGVVNFKLKQNFQGLNVDAQYGVTQEGDGQEYSASALIGGNFADDRGNATFAVTWSRRDAAYQKNHSFFSSAWTDAGTAGFAPAPQLPFSMYSTANYVTGNFFDVPSPAAVDCVFAGVGAGCPFPGKSGAIAGSVPVAFFGYYGVNNDGTAFYPGSAGAPTTGYTGALGPQFKILSQGPNAGTLQESAINSYVSLPLNRYSTFGSAHYDISEHVTAFLQGNMASVHTQTLGFDAPAVQFWSVQIPHGTGIDPQTVDAFGNTLANYQYLCPGAVNGCTNSQSHPLPAELAYLLDSRANPNAPFELDRDTNFAGPRRTDNSTMTYQVMAGLRGDVPNTDWTWELYGSHGETSTLSLAAGGFVSVARYQALAAAPDFGKNYFRNAGGVTPVPAYAAQCTTGLPLFSNFAASQDCLDSITAVMKSTTDLKQDIIEANMQGGLFDLPAGQLRYALGADYRKDSFQFLPDTLQDQQSFLDQPAGIFSSNAAVGSTSVKEIYGELLIPLIKDVPLIRSLNLEPGARYSDYDTAGGVWTYKILADWTVTDWLRFRGGYQHATRAPNIAELYTGSNAVVAGSTGDPCSAFFAQTWGNNAANANRAKVQSLCSALIAKFDPTFAYNPNAYAGLFGGNFPVTIDLVSGNPNLKPEVATTYTAGTIIRSPWQNAWLGGATLSIDYYNISIKDAIASLGSEISYEQCFNLDGVSNPTYTIAGNALCANINREPGSGYNRTGNAPYSNLGGIKTSGIDVQFDWRASLDDLGIGAPGALALNVVVNWLNDYQFQASPNGAFVNYTGTTNIGNISPQFKWRTYTTLTYMNGPGVLGMRWRHFPGLLDVTAASNPATTIDGVHSHDEFDLFGRWDVTKTYALRAGVDNLFNKSPEVVGSSINPATANNAQGATLGTYDQLGRRFYVGVSARF